MDTQATREGRPIPRGTTKALAAGRGLFALHEEGEEICSDNSNQGELKVEDEDLNRHTHAQYWDAITGGTLPANLTSEARREELKFMDE